MHERCDMMKMKDIDFKILSGLMKNSKISDRKLSKIIGVSQPTVTRRRAKLAKELSLDFTVIPDLAKLGMKILAFHFTDWKSESYEELSQLEDFQERVDKWISEQSNMIFASSGRGLGMGRVSIIVHKDYSDFVKYKAKVEKDWGRHLARYEVFIVSLESDKVKRPLTLKYLADYIESVHTP